MSCIAVIAYPPFLYYQNEGSYSSLNMQLFQIFSTATSVASAALELVEICLLLINVLCLLFIEYIRTSVQRHNPIVQLIVFIYAF